MADKKISDGTARSVDDLEDADVIEVEKPGTAILYKATIGDVRKRSNRDEYSETAHGFAVGDVLRRSSASAHAKAQADTDANIGVGLSLVVAVRDANTFHAIDAANSQEVTLTAHGFGSFGAKLYLSRTVAGAITATEPDPGWRVYLGYVVDANTIHWEPGWVRY